ncbi:MAG TPA: hypothetical protein VEC06_16850 [Paucimonas sp.]|nr:hypothetical protein [Paucimonas sp.]
MKRPFSALLIAILAFGAQQTFAQSDASAPAKQVKKAQAKKAKSKKAAAEEEKEPDTNGMTAVDFKCAHGDRITIYENPGDDKQVAMRWKRKLHQMTRVDTTTGAHRFENPKAGLVWIGIPAKGMLLDSKKGQQLANECRNHQQEQEAQTG